MLKPLILFITLVCFCYSVNAQATKTDSVSINVDSLEKDLDEFLAFYDSLKAPKNFWLFSAGVGNTQFSVSNVALNAQQSVTNLNFTPTIGYYHKSGLGITYNNYILLEAGKMQLLQHALTFSYDQTQLKKVSYGVSYTRFLGKKEFINTSSPYDNDVLAYLQLGKKKLTPGVMLGFSGGRYRETLQYLDSQQIRLLLTGQLVTQYFYVNDTSDIRIRDLSVIPYVRYDWVLDGFGKKDYFSLQPALLLLGSTTRVTVDSKGTVRRRRLLSRSRSYSGTDSQTNAFQFQSLGLQLDASWYIGNFFLNPQLYLDYYLLSSKNNLSTLYTVQAGFTF